MSQNRWATAILLSLLAAGCAAAPEAGVLDDGTPETLPEAASDAKADAPGIAFTALTDTVFPLAGASHKVFTSGSAYRTAFGHAAPGVDFRRDWLLYIDAGQRPTSGQTLAIDIVTRSASGQTLMIAAHVTTDGPSCNAPATPTIPYLLARINKQQTSYVRFTIRELAHDCPVPVNPCDTVRCAAGTHCSANGTMAACVADPVPCSIDNRCSGGGTCIQRTWDSCYPNRPGCLGVCVCTPPNEACAVGTHWDFSLPVCGCVAN